MHICAEYAVHCELWIKGKLDAVPGVIQFYREKVEPQL